ncbi:MAG: DUF1566 domain-containing protein [Candidatus Nitrotoga sp.]
MKTVTPPANGVAESGDPEALTQTRYIISTDGNEVTDSNTGLIWRRCAEGMKFITNSCSGMATAFSSDQAQSWAKNEALTSGKPWRLPSLKELSSIVDSCRCNPAIDTAAFPGTPGSPFWSAPPAEGEPSYAWGVNFDYGYVDYGSEHNSAGYRVRLVRSGE